MTADSASGAANEIVAASATADALEVKVETIPGGLRRIEFVVVAAMMGEAREGETWESTAPMFPDSSFTRISIVPSSVKVDR